MKIVLVDLIAGHLRIGCACKVDNFPQRDTESPHLQGEAREDLRGLSVGMSASSGENKNISQWTSS